MCSSALYADCGKTISFARACRGERGWLADYGVSCLKRLVFCEKASPSTTDLLIRGKDQAKWVPESCCIHLKHGGEHTG